MSRHEFNKTWLAAFVPQEIAFGTLSILIPLYAVIVLEQGPIYVGALRFAWALFSALSSAAFGQLCDQCKRYKPFVTSSFLLSGLITILLILPKEAMMFLAVYAIQGLFYAAARPVISILLAEWSPWERWRNVIGACTFVKTLAWANGLLIGAFAIPYLGYEGLLLLCGTLSLIASILSLLLIYDPPILLERKIISIDRSISTIDRTSLSLHLLENPIYARYAAQDIIHLIKTRFNEFLIGTFAFSFATGIISIQLPVFFRSIFISPQTVFWLFFLSSLMEALTRLTLSKAAGANAMTIACAIRCIAALLLTLVTALISPYPLYLSCAILISFGAAWALFDVAGNYVSMMTSPEGKGGLYFTFLNLGLIVGSLIGGIVAASYGFQTLFIVSSFLFALAVLFFLKTFEE